ELEPDASAVGVELRRVERARVEVLVARAEAAVRVGGAPRRRGDELVDVLAARVVAHVERERLAGHGEARPGAFVREAAERGALPRRRERVVRIDLDDPAEGVGDVAEIVAAVGRDAAAARTPAAELGARRGGR